MVFVPQWEWVLSALFVLVAVPLAVFVTAMAPSRAVNRTLGILLLAEGVSHGAGAMIGGLRHLDIAVPLGVSRFVFELVVVSLLAMPWLYLLFLAHALDTPVTRALRPKPVQGIIVAALVAMQAIRWLDPDVVLGELLTLSVWAATATATLGFVVALVAHRNTEKGSLAEQRSKAYLVAFAARDLSVALPLALIVLGDALGHFDAAFYATWADLVRGLVGLVFLAGLAYAILRVQIFDLDIKIRWSIKQGTIMTIFVAVFFIVNEGAQAFFQARLGVGPGIGAAALLVLALHPMQRFAEKVAEKVTPSAQPVERMSRAQRIDVYRDQIAVAWEDGNLSLKERRMLEVVRERLGLTLEEAVALERELWNRPDAMHVTAVAEG